jgi:sugar lactone lactonase YvrE
LTDRTDFVRFGESEGYPDGMAMDAEAHLWVAHYAGGAISRYRPDGSLAQRVALPVSQVTALAFGGADLRTLFITTAAAGLSPQARRREPLAGGLFAWPAPVAGWPQPACALG